MKSVAAILFSGILLFNLCGFRLLTDYLQSRQNTILEAQLDKHYYNEQELISIKTPLGLPYYASSKTFERVDGEIFMDGMVYKYVERRVYQDTLELLCIPDKDKMQLASARDEFFKWCNDLQSAHQTKKPAPAPAKNISLEYCSLSAPFFLSGIIVYKQKRFSHPDPYPFTAYVPVGEQPPEII